MTDRKKTKRTVRLDRVAMIVIPVLVLLILILFVIGEGCGKKKKEEAVKTPEPTQETTPDIEETPTPEPTIDPEKDPRFFDADSLLIVANKKHKLPDGYVPEDLAYPEVEMRYNDWTLRMEAAVALEEMFAAAENDRIHLVMGSGYRGEEFQKVLYDGYLEEGGQEYADSISSRPGYSDHQTGLATDLCGQDETYDLNQDFENTAEGKWLAANAYKYGFIMRYPKGKEEITGYAYEPWHFRYVGKDSAKEIHDAGANMTFEEYYHLSGGDYAG